MLYPTELRAQLQGHYRQHRPGASASNGIDILLNFALTARMTISLAGLTPQQLRRAADIKEKIVSLQNELNRLSGTPAATRKAPRRKWKMSAAAKAKISAAAKARWAKIKAGKK